MNGRTGGEASAGRRLTRVEQERGLRALAELERLDRELLGRRGGRPFASSWEMLDEAREERTRALEREA